jgi:hypothetical protein
MNQFYLTIDLLKQRLLNNVNVNTVIEARDGDKDLYKKNIYPLAVVNPTSADFSNSRVTFFTFEVAVLDQRDISKEPGDKYNGNDNYVDNLNITSAIINDLVNYLRLQNNDDLIELVSVTDANKVEMSGYNLLDGWFITLKLSVPNTQNYC